MRRGKVQRIWPLLSSEALRANVTFLSNTALAHFDYPYPCLLTKKTHKSSYDKTNIEGIMDEMRFVFFLHHKFEEEDDDTIYPLDFFPQSHPPRPLQHLLRSGTVRLNDQKHFHRQRH